MSEKCQKFEKIQVRSTGFRRNSSGEQTRYFVYPSHVADDAMQMHVHKTLCPFLHCCYDSSRNNSVSLPQQCFFFIHASFHTAQYKTTKLTTISSHCLAAFSMGRRS